MKLQVNAELVGAELLTLFLAQLKQNNIDAAPADIKILVKSKDGKEVDITPDRIRFSYAKEQV